MKVTAVLLNWKRPHNMPQIIAHLKRNEIFDQIVIVDNGKTLDQFSEDDVVQIVKCKHNFGTFGRKIGAALAINDIIYTQDDDCVVHNIPELLSEFLAREDQIVAGLSIGHYRHEWERSKKPWIQLGWGSFHWRHWLIAGVDAWIEKYGARDPMLWSKFDRIYSVLHGNHFAIPARYTPIIGPDGGHSERDGHSLWLQPDHREKVRQAVKRALELKECRKGFSA